MRGHGFATHWAGAICILYFQLCILAENNIFEVKSPARARLNNKTHFPGLLKYLTQILDSVDFIHGKGNEIDVSTKKPRLIADQHSMIEETMAGSKKKSRKEEMISTISAVSHFEKKRHSHSTGNGNSLKRKVSGDVVPNSVSICMGEDVIIRFTNIQGPLNSCNVTSPSGLDVQLFPHSESDSYQTRITYWDSGIKDERCGFRISSVSSEDYGKWNLSAESEKNSSTSLVQVTPKECTNAYDRQSEYIPGQVVSDRCGPPDSSICILHPPPRASGGTPPQTTTPGSTCSLPIVSFDSVMAGEWRCEWGNSASIRGRSSKTLLSRSASANLSMGLEWRNSTADEWSPGEVNLWCNMRKDVSRVIKSCRWIQPGGEVFYASEGLASGRYSYFGKTLIDGHCGLSIQQPLTKADEGVWRCELYWSEGMSGGYLELGVAKRTRDQKMKSLRYWGSSMDKSGSGVVVGVAGRSLSVGCSVDASVSFCLLRHPNGTRFTPPAPKEQGAFVFRGRGNDLGDCGLEIKRAEVGDSGVWQCVVGIDDGDATVVHINVRVYESDLVPKRTNAVRGYPVTVACESVLGAALEHCRFERPDLSVFTVADTNNPDAERATLAYGVKAVSDLAAGVCTAELSSVRDADIGEWLCVARIRGQEVTSKFTVSVQGISAASVGTISAIVVTAVVVSVIGAVVYSRVRTRRRQRLMLARSGNNEESPPGAIVNYRKDSDESSEASENGQPRPEN